nr:MAG TPA: hypothetical protein [Caudoviricetes sp.]
MCTPVFLYDTLSDFVDCVPRFVLWACTSITME